MKTPRAARGFTFIELVVTVAIMAILATAAVPLAQLTARRRQEQELHADLQLIRAAIDAYKAAAEAGRIERAADANGYPPDLDALVDGVADLRDPDRHKLYFLRRLPRDPLAADAAVPAAQTWGLRSYESPPDDPHDGKDVYDVHSLAEGRGLDGTPYRDW